MLPFGHRLRHDKDIKTLFAHSKSVFAPSFLIRYRPNKQATSRFVFIIGTKTAKLAVDRNRIKRKLRAIVEKYLVQIEPGFDVAFLAKKDVLQQRAPELEKLVVYALKKAKILL